MYTRGTVSNGTLLSNGLIQDEDGKLYHAYTIPIITTDTTSACDSPLIQMATISRAGCIWPEHSAEQDTICTYQSCAWKVWSRRTQNKKVAVITDTTVRVAGPAIIVDPD